MDSRFNIPAPPKFNLRGRVGGEGPGDESPGRASGRGGFGQSGFFKSCAKKNLSEY
jgi:hypothetical protein